MNYLGYVIAVFLLVWALGNIFDDGIDTSDDSVKDKIEIIEKAKNTTDTVVIEQGVIAKEELIKIQEKKKLEIMAEEAEEQRKIINENKEPLFDINNPVHIVMLVIFAFLFIGAGYIGLSRITNSNF